MERRNKLQEELSENTEWETPKKLFNQLNDYFHFTLDAAASASNALCEQFYTEKENGLLQKWADRTWLNPPYGNKIPAWMSKAKKESKWGRTVVCLVPCRTDTNWWFRSIWYDASLIIFLDGRVKFGDRGVVVGSAKFPSAIVVYNLLLDQKQQIEFTNCFSNLGRVVHLRTKEEDK